MGGRGLGLEGAQRARMYEKGRENMNVVNMLTTSDSRCASGYFY